MDISEQRLWALVALLLVVIVLAVVWRIRLWATGGALKWYGDGFDEQVQTIARLEMELHECRVERDYLRQKLSNPVEASGRWAVNCLSDRAATPGPVASMTGAASDGSDSAERDRT